MIKFLKNLLTNNTGVSLKSFIALSGIVLTTLMVLSIIIVLVTDLYSSYKVDTDLYGIAAVIGAVSAFVVAAIYGKVKGEEIEMERQNNQEINK
jgi:hypothetical protein